MTYADMITLLLCFFAIFLSISVPKEEQMEKARKEVMEHFASPNVLEGRTLHFEESSSESVVSESIPLDALPSIVDKYNAGEGGEGFNEGFGPTADKGEGKGPDADTGFKRLPEGDRMTSIEMPSAAFFERGSASVSPEGAKLLQKILDENLKKEDLKNYLITVEGHTDDAPIKTAQFPSNWELSAGRSAAVVRYFIENGIAAQRLRAIGYADAFPKVSNRDATGKPLPENQAQNRRVVIKLEKIERAQ